MSTVLPSNCIPTPEELADKDFSNAQAICCRIVKDMYERPADCVYLFQTSLLTNYSERAFEIAAGYFKSCGWNAQFLNNLPATPTLLIARWSDDTEST